MKRPIAEFLSVALKPGSEAEHAQYERETWQILRRKQGYVTHRIYQSLSDPVRQLVYAEWETPKAADGARQHLHGTPLLRRTRGLLAAAPQRELMEMVGAITSTKGIDLPDGAVAARAVIRLTEGADNWRAREEQLWKVLLDRAGYLSHVLLRGFGDPAVVGSFSHWSSAEAFTQAFTQLDSIVAPGADILTKATGYALYRPLRD